MKRVIGILIIFNFLLGVQFFECYAFPTKPIKVIIGYEAGSATDLSARKFFEYLEKELGQPLIIINKPGAASSLAMRELLREKPDGYTWGVSCSINVFKILGLMPQDHHDFEVIGVPAITPSIIAASAKTPFKSVKELVDYAKANPGKVRMSTTSKGAVFWIHAKYFERVTGIKLNIIPNPGGASFVATQLGGGHADVGIASYKPLQSQIDAGNIRVLGVNALERLKPLSQVPTLKEQGFNIVLNGWSGYIAPKGLPRDVYSKIISAFKKVASSKDWIDYNDSMGSKASPEYLGEGGIKFLDEDAEIQRPVLEEIGAAKK